MSVCLSAEQQIAQALDPSRYALEVVHLGNDCARIALARAEGVNSVPALLIAGQVFHIDHGTTRADL